jgi:sulfur carrier protein ThiS adenylyltransferase
MNDRDFMRYSRQILLGDIAIEGQQTLPRCIWRVRE